MQSSISHCTTKACFTFLVVLFREHIPSSPVTIEKSWGSMRHFCTFCACETARWLARTMPSWMLCEIRSSSDDNTSDTVDISTPIDWNQAAAGNVSWSCGSWLSRSIVTWTPSILTQATLQYLFDQHHTHTHSISTAIFSCEPGLADCPLNSPSPFIRELRIMTVLISTNIKYNTPKAVPYSISILFCLNGRLNNGRLYLSDQTKLCTKFLINDEFNTRV